MKVKDLNNSSKKTKRLIKNTFAELLKKHGELNKITVSDLVKKADINRGTFYNHYDSIYSVAEDFEAEVIKVLFEDTKSVSSIEDVFKYIDNIFSYLKKNENIYRLLLSSKEPLIFLEKLKISISNKLFSFLNNNPNFNKSTSLKFNINFYTDGVVNQILRYFRGIEEFSLDEICSNSKELFKIFFC